MACGSDQLFQLSAGRLPNQLILIGYLGQQILQKILLPLKGISFLLLEPAVLMVSGHMLRKTLGIARLL